MATGPYLLVCEEVSTETGNCLNQSWVKVDADFLAEQPLVSREEWDGLIVAIIGIWAVIFIFGQIKKMIEQ